MKKSGLTIVGEYRRGWAVEISRDDGSTFLASGGSSVLPFVHVHRKWAVKFKRELVADGFRARIVPVEFVQPWRVPER